MKPYSDAEAEAWQKGVDRYNKRQEAKIRKEHMPATEEDCKREIEQETYKCAWHSHGFNPARRCRLIAHAKKNGWKY